MAAALAAKFWQDRKQIVAPGSAASRDVIKADFQILATAVTRKASILYTHDDELLKMKQSCITVSKMPEGLARQEDLFH